MGVGFTIALESPATVSKLLFDILIIPIFRLIVIHSLSTETLSS